MILLILKIMFLNFKITLRCFKLITADIIFLHRFYFINTSATELHGFLLLLIRLLCTYYLHTPRNRTIYRVKYVI